MKSETKIWLDYAEENLKSSKILLDNKLYNPSLQNTQQSVEKALKAIIVEYGIHLKRTHDILELKYLLQRKKIIVNISDDECDLLNAIYLPSKYPMGDTTDESDPDDELCRISIDIAEKAPIQG
ncbi:MAG: HEPN domain-containing protein [Pseudanabaena sp. ELA607]